MNTGRGMRVRLTAASALLLGAIVVAGAEGAKLTTRSASTTIAPGETGGKAATCKRGTKAISGGWRSEAEGGPFAFAIDSVGVGKRRWRARQWNLGVAGDVSSTTYAYCRDQRLVTRTKRTTFSEDETRTVVARCPAGTKALSGGFDADRSDDGLLLVNSSRRAGRRAWAVTGHDYMGAVELAVKVNCHRGRALAKRQKTETIGSLAPGDDVVVAKCKRNRRVVAGGFHSGEGISKVGPYFAESRKQGKRKWRVKVGLIGELPITAYAYCERRGR